MNALLQLGVVRVLQIYGHADRLTRLQQILPPDEVTEEGDDPSANAEKHTVDSIRKTHDETHRSFLPPNEKEELATAEEIEPLCKRIGHSGTFTCMPHSVKFAFDWDKLDTDGDGVWSHAEAVADASNLRAKRGISPETIFNNLINGLRFHSEFVKHSGHNRTFYLSPDVENEQNIPKQLDTFTYLSQVTWTLFFFTVFFAIMVTHALPAISRSINVRLKKLSSGGSSQGALGDEEVSVFTSFEKLLSNSFESSRTLITKTSVSASDWVKSMTQEVNALHLTGSNVSYVKGLGSIAATTQTLTKKS
jgi:hypothetical protein